MTAISLPIQERAPRRALLAALGTMLCLLVFAAEAGAHAVVRPGSSRPADLQVYTLSVPNERDVATDEVAMQVPADIDFLLVDDAPGWKIDLDRRNGRIAVVRWRDGSIEPSFYGTLRFIARNPVREGELEWKINQHYADGRTVRWIGPRGSDTPASFTRISEAAAPVDVVSVHGEKDSSPTSPPPATTDDQVKTDERDELALILGAAGLGVGLVALLLTLRIRRR